MEYFQGKESHESGHDLSNVIPKMANASDGHICFVSHMSWICAQIKNGQSYNL